jgi:hypothetical protein
MPVRGSERADREGMLDDGHLSPVVTAVQLEYRPKTGQRDRVSFARLHYRDANRIHLDHLTSLFGPAAFVDDADEVEAGRLGSTCSNMSAFIVPYVLKGRRFRPSVKAAGMRFLKSGRG